MIKIGLFIVFIFSEWLIQYDLIYEQTLGIFSECNNYYIE